MLETKVEEVPNAEVTDFYVKMQEKLRAAIIGVLSEMGNEAKRLDLGLAIPARAAGTALACAFFNVSGGLETGLTREEFECFSDTADQVAEAFKQHIAYLYVKTGVKSTRKH